jgi:hypothetical protein
MMHSLVSRSALVTAFLLAGTALAQGAVIKDNHLKFNGKSYFRAGSESVELGSYGEKKTPIAKANYLEVQGHVARPKLEVRTATIVDIDFKQSTEKDFKANVLAGAVGGSVDTAYKRLDKGELKLVKFEVELVDMKKALNDSPIVRDNLDKYGGDARVCHQIFVVLEASIATKISSSTSLAVAGTTGGLTVTAKGKTKDEKDTTVTLSKGTTFAYLLAKMDWDKKNGDKVVEKLTDDQFSMN